MDKEQYVEVPVCTAQNIFLHTALVLVSDVVREKLKVICFSQRLTF